MFVAESFARSKIVASISLLPLDFANNRMKIDGFLPISYADSSCVFVERENTANFFQELFDNVASLKNT